MYRIFIDRSKLFSQPPQPHHDRDLRVLVVELRMPAVINQLINYNRCIIILDINVLIPNFFYLLNDPKNLSSYKCNKWVQ